MATITSAGIGSGLDINSIVTQLLAIERQPLVALERQETQLTTKHEMQCRLGRPFRSEPNAMLEPRATPWAGIIRPARLSPEGVS